MFSVTKRLPALSRANPRGDLRPVAKVLSVPPGVNSRMDPMVKSDVRVETKRLPALSKVNCPEGDSLPKAAGPAKVVRAPPGVYSKTVWSTASTAKRFPALLKARPKPPPSPDAKVLRVPPGVNLKIVLPQWDGRIRHHKDVTRGIYSNTF